MPQQSQGSKTAAWFAAPGQFLDGLDFERRQARLLTLDRGVLVDSAFLDERVALANKAFSPIGFDDFLDARARAGANARTPAFVFHTAFCCSTLLARALDKEGACLSLKEPNVLADLAHAKRAGVPAGLDDGEWPLIIDSTLDALGRSFVGTETTLIKPTNLANNIVPDMLAARGGAKSIFLFSDLKSFLISILKRGEEGRWFARHAFRLFAGDTGQTADWPRAAIEELTDLQAAALAWAFQLSMFMNWRQSGLAANMRTLNADDLLADPAPVLAAAARHLEVPLTPEEASAIASGPLFTRHAKSQGAAYSSDDRAAENKRLEQTFGQVITHVMNWCARLGVDGRVAQLPNPLMS